MHVLQIVRTEMKELLSNYVGEYKGYRKTITIYGKSTDLP